MQDRTGAPTILKQDQTPLWSESKDLDIFKQVHKLYIHHQIPSEAKLLIKVNTKSQLTHFTVIYTFMDSLCMIQESILFLIKKSFSL